jgi:6-pyruvoyltetrahydropterin/6-carboxytetrahydropterin synthase
MKYQSTKILDLGSCAFRQWRADHSHCQYIHGYKLQAKFWFNCTELDNKNWVVDFGGLKGLKDIIEEQFDHTFCVSQDDPCLKDFKDLATKGACKLRIMDGVGIEKTAEWCFINANKFIRSHTKGRCWVSRVEVWEHDRNSAIVSADCESVPEHNPYVATQPDNIIESSTPTVLDNTDDTTAARVTPNVTSGWGNPLGGTSWGL